MTQPRAEGVERPEEQIVDWLAVALGAPPAWGSAAVADRGHSAPGSARRTSPELTRSPRSRAAALSQLSGTPPRADAPR